MCGIFGAIGTGINPGIIRALALVNRERGTDSLGFFDNTGKSWKSAKDPIRALSQKDCAEFVDRAACKGWFIAGHTRHATHGHVSKRNAHPFRFGRIIGSHNGIVDYPYDRDYKVDSEYLFDQLNRHDGNYQAAFADIDGYWGLSWFDGCNFWLQAHDNTVYAARGVGGKVWYYSSDYAHLAACLGKVGTTVKLAKGRTIRFAVNSTEYEGMPDFKSSSKYSYKQDWRTSGKRGGGKSIMVGACSLLFPGKAPVKGGVLAETELVEFPNAPKKSKGRIVSVEEESIEYSILDELARDAGYASGVDFMSLEGFKSVERAAEYLEFNNPRGKSNSEAWAEYSNFDERLY